MATIRIHAMFKLGKRNEPYDLAKVINTQNMFPSKQRYFNNLYKCCSKRQQAKDNRNRFLQTLELSTVCTKRSTPFFILIEVRVTSILEISILNCFQ